MTYCVTLLELRVAAAMAAFDAAPEYSDGGHWQLCEPRGAIALTKCAGPNCAGRNLSVLLQQGAVVC